MSHITPAELALWQRGGLAHTLIDVRRAAARQNDGTEIAGGRWQDPALWLDWKDAVATDGLVVLYCVHGHEVSQGLAAALRAMGVDARHLAGGIAAWKTSGEAVAVLAG
ncbi:MAG: sulfurtransferase [Denitromonas halophila]|nr:MAG: sulfurtransferase [Denitromonas halophila]